MNDKMMTDYITLLLDQKIAELSKMSDDYHTWANSGGYTEYQTAQYSGMWQGTAKGIVALKEIKQRMGL